MSTSTKTMSVTFEDLEQHWCPHRGRFVPEALKGTKPPSAVDGPGWVEQQKHEEVLLAQFDAEVQRRRKDYRLDVQGLLNPRDADPRNR